MSIFSISQNFSRCMTGALLSIGLIIFVPVSNLSAQDYGGDQGGGEGQQQQTKKVTGINAKTYEKFAEAQILMEAEDYKGALKILDELKAKPKLSSTEAIQLYSFYGVLYFNQEKYKDSIKAFESMLAQPDLEERQRTETLYTLAQLHFTIEDWQGAIDIMEDWIKAVENPPPDPFILLASAFYQLEDFAKMVEPIERAMSIARERDKPIKESWWLLLRAAHYSLQDYKEVTRILEILVVNWPKKDYWTMLSGMYGELNMESKQLAAYEAAYDQDLFDNGKEVVALSQLLMQAEAPFKAAKVLEKGLDSGLVEKTESNYRYLSQAWQLAAEYEKAIPPLKQAAGISEDGELDVRLANSYLNLSRYDECVKSARAGIKRGGLKRPATAQELLGMCLFEQDKYEEAIAAFRQAAKDEKTEKRARNWIKYIQTEQARIEQLNESIRQARMAREALGR
jgi:tetratricopeptide (TPR) repeat protein